MNTSPYDIAELDATEELDILNELIGTSAIDSLSNYVNHPSQSVLDSIH